MNQQFGEVHELIDNERKKREESENNFVQNFVMVFVYYFFDFRSF